MRTYNFNPLSKGLQDVERALAAIQMIGNGTIEERAYAMTGATKSTVAYMMKLGVTSASELTFAQRLRLSTMALWEQAAAWAQTKAWLVFPLWLWYNSGNFKQQV